MKSAMLRPIAPVSEQFAVRDEAIEPPFVRTEPFDQTRKIHWATEEAPVTARWIADQALNSLRQAQGAMQKADHLYGNGESDTARDYLMASQDAEWQARLHSEKLLELAVGSYVGSYCSPPPVSLDRFVECPEEYAKFADQLIDGLDKSGELPQREVLFTERNDALHALWISWYKSLPDFSEGSQARVTDLKARWQPRFDALYSSYCLKAESIGESARAWHEQRLRELSAQPARSDSFPVVTTQEWEALECSAADGKSGRNYRNDGQGQSRIHRIEGKPHYVKLALTEQDLDAGFEVMDLERLTDRQDADSIFALLYISNLLAPTQPLQSGYAGGWIDLNDVIGKIGWNPRTTKQREQMRAQVWDYLCFGARAVVIGKRTTQYHDKRTGQVIDTQVESPLWAIMERETPVQPSLLPAFDVPLRVEIVLSKRWEALLTNPDTAQFLPLGELLGAIPGSQPSGAWARTVGLALAGFWRRHPRETLKQTLRPTRRELLTRFTPKTAAPMDVLESNDPKRAIDYWLGALAELAETGFLSRTGETIRSSFHIRQGLPRYHWQEEWLDEAVELTPGPQMDAAIRRCANNLPPLRSPRALPGSRRRGRPRKEEAGVTEAEY